jgi:glycosyltransferase involved in cell wall biosynthesis
MSLTTTDACCPEVNVGGTEIEARAKAGCKVNVAALVTPAAELGIASRVFFSNGKGSVPDFLRRMSIGCLCSQSEGFSNAILEYMAAGLPVVATDVGGNDEAIQDGVTGCIVRTREPEAFARPVIRLLRDEKLRSELARRSLERCRDKFEIGAAIRRLERYYLGLSGAGE